MKKKILSLVTLLAVVLLMMPSVKAEAASITNPKVVIENVEFNDSVISITLANKSKTVGVTDVLVTYASDKDIIVPIDGQSNQIYIESIGASKEATVEFPVVIRGTGNTSAKVEFKIEYVVASSDVQKTNSSFIMLDLSAVGDNLTITNFSFPQDGYLNEKGLLSFNYKNATDSDITNLKLSVSGLNDGSVEVFNVGDIKAKKNGYFETYVSYNTLGSREVVVSYEYTTNDGEVVTSEGLLYYVQVTERIVEPTTFVADDSSPEQQGGNSFNMSYLFIGLAGILVVICAVLAINSTRKNK